MYVEIVVVAVCCGSLLILAAILVHCKRKSTKPYRVWLKEYTRADKLGVDQLLKLRPAPKGWRNRKPTRLWLDISNALDDIAMLRKAEQDRKEADLRAKRLGAQVAKLRAKVLDDSDYLELDDLLKWQRHYMTDTDRKWVFTQTARLASEKADTLLAKARSGDAGAFNELRALVYPSVYGASWGDDSPYFRASGKRYAYPNDWDELVVRFIESPRRSDFHGALTEHVGRTNEFVLFAAQALRDRSLIRCKLVLAYCTSTDWWGVSSKTYRRLLGDILWANIVEMVDRLHTELELDFTATTVS